MKPLLVAAVLVACAAFACSDEAPSSQVPVPGHNAATKTNAETRGTRRLFDGAPPVIPHAPMGANCIQCHNRFGMEVEGLGYSPPSPHAETVGMSATSRCVQCHVFRQTDAVFVANAFDGLKQDLRRGARLYTDAPPVVPHSFQMRENCAACHSGPAAREEVRCTHPDRARCEQCHVPQVTTQLFARS